MTSLVKAHLDFEVMLRRQNSSFPRDQKMAYNFNRIVTQLFREHLMYPNVICQVFGCLPVPLPFWKVAWTWGHHGYRNKHKYADINIYITPNISLIIYIFHVYTKFDLQIPNSIANSLLFISYIHHHPSGENCNMEEEDTAECDELADDLLAEYFSGVSWPLLGSN